MINKIAEEILELMRVSQDVESYLHDIEYIIKNNLSDFVHVTNAMRAAQEKYHRSKTSMNFKRVKVLETDFDKSFKKAFEELNTKKQVSQKSIW